MRHQSVVQAFKILALWRSFELFNSIEVIAEFVELGFIVGVWVVQDESYRQELENIQMNWVRQLAQVNEKLVFRRYCAVVLEVVYDIFLPILTHLVKLDSSRNGGPFELEKCWRRKGFCPAWTQFHYPLNQFVIIAA